MIEYEIKVNPRDNKRAHLRLKCDKTKNGFCEFPIWTGVQGGVMWNWNGDKDLPTIAPSINCLGGCGKHLVITLGKVTWGGG